MLRWLARCQTSILVAALNDLPDADLDLAVVLANVGLRCLAPATVEQRDSSGHPVPRIGQALDQRINRSGRVLTREGYDLVGVF